MRPHRRPVLLLGALLAFGVGVVLAVAIDRDLGHAVGPITGGGPALVELGSTSCASCRAMQPVLAELRAKHGGRLDVRSIDVFKQRDAIAGLVLLDVVPVPAVPVGSNSGGSTRLRSAFGLGAAFSVATGPCSLAFVAPLLALPIAGVASTPLDMGAAVAMFVAGHAMGAGLAWAIAQRGANWLGDHASTRLRWARTTAGLLLVTLAGWMTANAIMTG